MILWLFRFFIVLSCPVIVYFEITKDWRGLLVGLVVGLVIVGFEMLVAGISLLTMISGILGASGGIIVAKLIDYTVFQIGNNALYLTWARYAALRYFAFAVLGMILAVRKLPEFDDLDRDILKMGKKRGAELKVLDTSAIIDGRLVDIAETHFVSGTFIVPRFVLAELNLLADSSDSMKRARGRRGLDILARLQENSEVPVKIIDTDFPDIKSVDGKIIRLAGDLGGKVITTDFNLNKVASLQGVTCLNVNDLGLALKPVALPGENMAVFVMKEGKEKEQGVGYLDDGTMVVVEDGRKHIGKRIESVVMSILQTSAGRMIFTKARAVPTEERAA